MVLALVGFTKVGHVGWGGVISLLPVPGDAEAATPRRFGPGSQAEPREDHGPGPRGILDSGLGFGCCHQRRPAMTRHLIDHRSPSQGSRVRHFMRLSRAERPAWHRSESFTGNSRLVHYCRIARGWTV